MGVAIISSRWKNWGCLDKKWGPRPPGPGLEPPLRAVRAGESGTVLYHGLAHRRASTLPCKNGIVRRASKSIIQMQLRGHQMPYYFLKHYGAYGIRHALLCHRPVGGVIKR